MRAVPGVTVANRDGSGAADAVGIVADQAGRAVLEDAVVGIRRDGGGPERAGGELLGDAGWSRRADS